jgi:hypothetical protein
MTVNSLRRNDSGLMYSHTLLRTVISYLIFRFSIQYDWNAEIHWNFTAVFTKDTFTVCTFE